MSLPGPKGSSACPWRLAPRLGRLHARSGAALVHVPEGIDPTCMPLGALPLYMVDADQAPLSCDNPHKDLLVSGAAA